MANRAIEFDQFVHTLLSLFLRLLSSFFRFLLLIRIFGDNDNDMDMLKCVGTGILMGNARNDLKERIPYVTCDNDSDGIYHALAEMGIL